MTVTRMVRYYSRCGILLCCIALCACQAHRQTVTRELSSEAEAMYALLLLDQSMRGDSVSGVFDAAEIFLKNASDSKQQLIEAAGWLILNKENQMARSVLTKSIAGLPDDPAFHLMLAETWIEDSNIDKAISVLKNFTSEHPQTESLIPELALLLYKVGRYQESLDSLSAIPENRRTVRMRLCAGISLTKLGKYGDAVKELSLALRTDPSSDDIREALADALELAGNTEQSRTLYRSLLNKNPDNARVRLRCIILELNDKKPKVALRIALKTGFDNSFYMTAAGLFLEKGYPGTAAALMRELIRGQEAPDEYRLVYAVALYEQSHNMSEAAAVLDAIESDSPIADRVSYTKARLLLAEHSFDAASAVLEKALSKSPGNIDLALLSAQTYIAVGKFDKAGVVLDNAALRSPDNTELLFLQATVHDRRGNEADALSVMEHILTLDPDDYRALNYIGFKLADTYSADTPTDLNRALTLLRKAVSLAPDKAYIRDSLAWAMFKSGDIASAWHHICATVTMKNGSLEAEIWDHYGDIALAIGNTAEARHGWRNALKMAPNDQIKTKLLKLPTK